MGGLGIVTGGARGLGLGMVRALLDAGVVDEVAVFDLVAAELEEAEVHVCDVTDEASVASALEALGDREVQVLVNNAGGGKFGEDLTELFPPVDHWRSIVELNLISPYLVTRAVVPRMGEGSAICNTASLSALATVPPVLGAYGAAKTGLVHLTQDLARSLGPQGIRVNAVAPGFIWTDLWQKWIGEKAMFDEMVAANTPLGGEQKAEDIGKAVAFLCSDAATHITGQVLAVDGGAAMAKL